MLSANELKDQNNKEFELVIDEMNRFYQSLINHFNKRRSSISQNFIQECVDNNFKIKTVIEEFKQFTNQLNKMGLKPQEETALRHYFDAFLKFFKNPSDDNTQELTTQLENLLTFTKGSTTKKVFAGLGVGLGAALTIGPLPTAIIFGAILFTTLAGTGMAGLAGVLAIILMVGAAYLISRYLGAPLLGVSVNTLSEARKSKFIDAEKPVFTLGNERRLRDDKSPIANTPKQYNNFFKHIEENAFFQTQQTAENKQANLNALTYPATR